MKSKNGRSLLLNGLPYAATPGGFSIRGGVLGYPAWYLCGNSRKRVVYKLNDNYGNRAGIYPENRAERV